MYCDMLPVTWSASYSLVTGAVVTVKCVIPNDASATEFLCRRCIMFIVVVIERVLWFEYGGTEGG
jgi:hypothetical protein